MTVDAYEQLTARRDPGAGGEHAVDGAVRPADRRIPRQVLPPSSPRGSRWRRAPRSAGTAGWVLRAIIGMSTFGASAPLKVLQAKFGFTPEAVVAAAKRQMGH